MSTDISDVIKRHSVELAALLRTTNSLTGEDISRLAEPIRNFVGKAYHEG